MAEKFWDTLFPTDSKSGLIVERQMRLLKKGGRPFLLLPQNGSRAARCMELYPAQTGKARLAKSALSWLLRLSVPAGDEGVLLRLNSKNGFIEFLNSLSPGAVGGIPDFGILAGNPAADTQRFIILLFDAKGKPASVVKAGLSANARELVARESSFLAAVKTGTIGIPKLLKTYSDSNVTALAVPYLNGRVPETSDQAGSSRLLSSWAVPKEAVCLRDIGLWRTLTNTCDPAELRILNPNLKERFVPLTITHGDFAPWNIKVLPDGDWVALDWERGELQGIPGWDWFHYLIQPGILVKKLPPSELANQSEKLLTSPAFQKYAAVTGIRDLERDLLLAYLLHIVQVVQPAEGLAENRELLKLLIERWSRRK